jgi:signal transduction histidine kinase
VHGRDTVELPAASSPTDVGVYTADGTRMAGRGPARADAVTARALHGAVAEETVGGQLVVAVPVRQGERVIAAARASVPVRRALDRVRWAWAAMAVLGALAVGAAAVVAGRQAGRLARPLVDLAIAARTLGDGDLTARAPRSGVPEIDVAAVALDDTAGRLGELIARERAFSAHASHQLRTPLTGLRLLLESAAGGTEDELRRATSQALEATDRLEQTIDELLALARSDSAASPLDVDALLADLHAGRVGPLGATGRAFRTARDEVLPEVRASAGSVRQVLAVLLDNATVHGRGTVTVRARDAGDALALDVEDEGDGPPVDVDLFRRTESGPSRHGLGLPLARALAEAEGGRLVLSRPGPQPRFTLVLPESSVTSSGGRRVPVSLP